MHRSNCYLLLTTALALLGSACGGGDSGGGGGKQAVTGEVRVVVGMTADWPTADPNDDPDLKKFDALLKEPWTEPCPTLPAGFDDLGDGTTVVAKNGEGDTIGATRLSDGKFVYTKEGPACTFAFDLSVPPDEDFVIVKVANRGEETYTSDDLKAAGGKISLTIG